MCKYTVSEKYSLLLFIAQLNRCKICLVFACINKINISRLFLLEWNIWEIDLSINYILVIFVRGHAFSIFHSNYMHFGIQTASTDLIKMEKTIFRTYLLMIVFTTSFCTDFQWRWQRWQNDDGTRRLCTSQFSHRSSWANTYWPCIFNTWSGNTKTD